MPYNCVYRSNEAMSIFYPPPAHQHVVKKQRNIRDTKSAEYELAVYTYAISKASLSHETKVELSKKKTNKLSSVFEIRRVALSVRLSKGVLRI